MAIAIMSGCTAHVAAQSVLERHGNGAHLKVNGQPMLLLGGELSNSAATCFDDIDRVMPEMKRIGLNTVLVPAQWDLVEPREGEYDFSLIGRTIDKARENKLKVVFLWFGAWKNSMSCYAPMWFKEDLKRFPRAITATGKPMEIASAFSKNVLEADRRAFSKLMEYIKEKDKEQSTVIMVQVENEIGMLESARDYSPEATRLYNSEVPEELLSYLESHAQTLHPYTLKKLTGCETLSQESKKTLSEKLKRGGTWAALFGDDIYTEEMFMAYHYAKYVEQLACSAQGIHDIPLYVNAALFTDDGGAAFQAFMEGKGFTYNESNDSFTHPELPFVVYYTVSDGMVQLNSLYQPAQKEPQPTFSKVPATDRNHLLHFAEGGIHGGTLDDVAAWEAENGGIFAESVPESDYTSYSVTGQPESLITRGYWDDKLTAGFIGEIQATQDIYTDLSRVYYIDEATGNMYETEEFLKLLADNGYTFLGTNTSGFQFYGNSEIQLGMLAFEMTPGETVIQFQAMKIGNAPSVKSILLDPEVRFDFLKKVSDRFEALNDGHIIVPLR